MLSLGSKVAWLKGYVIVAGVLLVLLGWYYLHYIPERKAQISSRNFRVLADLSDHIRSEILLLPSVLSNSAASSESAQGGDTNRTLEVINKSLRNLALLSESWTETNFRGLKFTNHAEGDSSALVFDYYRTNHSIHASAPLRRIIGPLANIADFDDILLLDGSGEVLYQRGGAEFRYTRLELTNAPVGHSFQTDLTIKPTSTWFRGSGGDVVMFAQPLRFSVLPDEADSKSSCDWLVCGLVSSDQFMSRARAVPYAELTAILLIMTFFALAWPFVDLWSAPSSLPLRPWHLVIHYYCGLSICALVTLGLFLVAGYQGLEEQLDDQMKKVSTNMLSNFEAELEAISAQSRSFDKCYEAEGCCTDKTNILSNPELCSVPTPGQSNSVATYPAFKMIVWMDANGMQSNKWTTETRNTQKINVGSRDYFGNVIGGRVWTKDINAQPWRFFIEPVYSWNTGENEAVVSQPRDKKMIPVVALDARFQTFFNPVLPVDLGFCVIDETGKVLFHSDESRNLRENFVVECDNEPRIRAAIQGRTPEALDAQYLNKSCSLFLAPIPDLPWTLVIFRDELKLQTILLESSYAVLVLYAASLLLLFGFVSLLAVFTKDRGWLWPDAGRRDHYKRAAAVNLFVGAPCLWLLAKSASEQTVVVGTLFVPMLTLLANWIILRFPNPKSKRPRAGDVVWYCMALGSLILAGSVGPTAQFFRLIFDEESGLLVRRGQMHVAKQLDERKHRLRSEYARLGDSQSVEGFLTSRLANIAADCFVANNFFNTSLRVENVAKDGTPTTQPGETMVEMARLRVLFDETTRESSAYVANGDIKGFWHWDYSNAPANTLTFYREETDEEKKPNSWGMVITSRPWSIKEIVLWRWLVTGLGCLAIVSLVAWRLYAGFFRLKRDALKPRWGFRLVLGDQELVPSAGYFVSKCEHPYCELEFPDQKVQGIWIKNFDAGAHDPKATQKKLRFLRRCISNAVGRVVIQSRIHPLNFTFDTQPDSDFAVSQRLDWSQILLQFRTWFPSKVRQRLRKPEAWEFESIWAICSPSEKRVLHQIAQDMLLNPKQPEIKALIRNGLVTLSPGPCIGSDLFRKWIVRSVATSELPDPKPSAQEDRWGPIKGPLLFGAVACAAVFFLTQRTLWEHTVSLIPAFLAGLTGVASLGKALMQFKSGKEAGADKQPGGTDSPG